MAFSLTMQNDLVETDVGERVAIKVTDMLGKETLSVWEGV